MMTFACCSVVIVIFLMLRTREACALRRCRTSWICWPAWRTRIKPTPLQLGSRRENVRFLSETGTELTPLQLGSRRENVRLLSEAGTEFTPLQLGLRRENVRFLSKAEQSLTPLQLRSIRENARFLSESHHPHFPLNWKISQTVAAAAEQS
jgi:hypothetical protein